MTTFWRGNHIQTVRILCRTKITLPNLIRISWKPHPLCLEEQQLLHVLAGKAPSRSLTHAARRQRAWLSPSAGRQECGNKYVILPPKNKQKQHITRYSSVVINTYKRRDTRQQRFHEVTQKNWAQHEKPSIACRHLGSVACTVGCPLQLWRSGTVAGLAKRCSSELEFIIMTKTTKTLSVFSDTRNGVEDGALLIFFFFF